MVQTKGKGLGLKIVSKIKQQKMTIKKKGDPMRQLELISDLKMSRNDTFLPPSFVTSQ